jgi:hypothetical protein
MPYDLNWRQRGLRILFLLLPLCLFTSAAHADLASIGANLLQTLTTNLNGGGIWVAQPEADVNTNQPPSFEVNPVTAGNPLVPFSYYSSIGMIGTFPNTVGAESWHANQVGSIFYGLSAGVATNVAHVDNYDADYFVNSIVATGAHINGQVVNQSFIFNGITISQQQMIDSAYDNFADQFSTLFVSGVGNGGPVNAPATCYNGIGVAAYGGSSSVGPTPDNGRAKPDITAPASATSYSTPQVAGAVTLLLQAGLRGDGGPDTNSASDTRAIKALLLNGAVKPSDWTNTSTSSLDPRYGAGVVNVFNSYKQLSGGEQGYTVSSSVPTNSPHPPVAAAAAISQLSGWDFNTINSDATSDAVNHYFFNVTNNAGGAAFTATATLVWNRQNGQTSINNLDLFLYDAGTGSLIASSTSLVDNVEHLFVVQLPPGRYDLQVLKHGGAAVSTAETYALAFEFFNISLNITSAGPNKIITWPTYPAGFVLESTPTLVPPNWSTNNPAPVVVGDLFSVAITPSVGNQFFRLRRP